MRIPAVVGQISRHTHFRVVSSFAISQGVVFVTSLARIPLVVAAIGSGWLRRCCRRNFSSSVDSARDHKRDAPHTGVGSLKTSAEGTSLAHSRPLRKCIRGHDSWFFCWD